ncbi:alkaline phosphatase family protein [Halorarius litoreus]|uniref:alkaline phosphatase family protein n=1 Tax=Halorarius litoreus TaxID=2962676 RepID=UPI0020CE7AD6|nr:alkaline phosphatase family protein [Halorarius litoreus]
MGNGTGQRVLALAVEGMSDRVLEPLVADGVVPNLAGLLTAGVAEPLGVEPGASPERTAAALATGVGPGKHGVFGSRRRDGTPVDATDLQEQTLWELLDEHGVASVVVDAPLSSPPPAINGAILPGGSAAPTCHPDGLLEELRAEIGEYQLSPPAASTRADHVAGLQQLAAMRGRAFRYLVGRYDPGFGYLHFGQPAAMAEARPGDAAALRDVYAAVDEAIGQVLDAWTPGVVLVVSGYGIESTTGYEFRVNDFLEDRGHLVTSAADAVETADPSQRGPLTQLLAGIRSAVGLGGEDQPATEEPTERARVVDHGASAGYAVDATGVYLDGSLDAATAARVRSTIVDAFEAVETPDGNPVFARVDPRAGAFDGDAVDRAPDIALEPADGIALSATLEGAVFGPKTTLARRTAPGLLGIAGRCINAEAACTGATLLDVAPTVLSALNVPWSDRMDGRPLPVVEPTVEASYPMGEASTAATATGGSRQLADPSSAE